jgi:hypothetical protein
MGASSSIEPVGAWRKKKWEGQVRTSRKLNGRAVLEGSDGQVKLTLLALPS